MSFTVLKDYIFFHKTKVVRLEKKGIM